MNEYEDDRAWLEFESGETFVRHCVTCGRFVKANEVVRTGEAGLHPEPNAICKKCGPTRMIFMGFM